MAEPRTPTVDSTSPDRASAARASRTRRNDEVAPRQRAAAKRTRVMQLALLAVAAVISIDAVVGEKGLLETFRARRGHAALVQSIGQLQRDNARMRDYVRRLREDPAAIEEVARRKHGLIKPGEVLIIVRDAEKR